MTIDAPSAKRRSRHARAVVTGAGSGIGSALALELARRGGEVVCADLVAVRAEETVALITGARLPPHQRLDQLTRPAYRQQRRRGTR